MTQSKSLWLVGLTLASAIKSTIALNGVSHRELPQEGPLIVTAVRTLDDILHRMQSHQEKKRSMLRKLRVASAFSVGVSSA